jgi:hypothetical protein
VAEQPPETACRVRPKIDRIFDLVLVSRTASIAFVSFSAPGSNKTVLPVVGHHPPAKDRRWSSFQFILEGLRRSQPTTCRQVKARR